MVKRQASPAEEERSVGTFDDFRSAVKFVLMREHSTPEMLADEILTIDAEYLQAAFEEVSKKSDELKISDVAEELAVRPRRGVRWIRVEEDSVVVGTSKQLDEYLDNLVASGLFGDDRNEVAHAMLCRGVESVISLASGSKRR